MTLKRRLLLISLVALCVAFGIIGGMFVYTTGSLRRKTVESLDYVSREISTKVDEIVFNIQNVSDAFANEPQLKGYLDSVSTGIDEKTKLYTIWKIRNNVFGGFNRLKDINQISAIYNVPNNQLFNFVAPAVAGPDVIDKLLQLDITNPAKLSKYYLYPLQENFLLENAGTGRQSMAVLGSRRIYDDSRSSNPYPYVHIFAIPEERIYSCYQNQLEQVGEVYIVDTEGRLISSSNEQAVADLHVPPELWEALRSRTSNQFEWSKAGRGYFVSVCQSDLRIGNWENGGWLTVLVTPKAYATRDLTGLYVGIVVAMLFCVFLCAMLVLYLYKQFMDPISDLSTAMRRAGEGHMDAYVVGKNVNNEAGEMIEQYNEMLTSINRSVNDKIEYEKAKKDLDMQVLTSQINPHFLYNTLETIVWKAGEAGLPDIGKIASSLGKLYRLSVSGDEVWVPLSQEIEHVKSYVNIQRSRYEGQFGFTTDVDTAALEIRVPKIILQPIVENVFLHAMQGGDKYLDIRLTVRLRHNGLYIKVLDNGPGIAAEKLQEVRAQICTGVLPAEGGAVHGRRSSGIGLHNIYSRLSLYMGANDALRIYSKQGRGTKVCIFISQNNLEQGGEG